jgi:hypothetical protein
MERRADEVDAMTDKKFHAVIAWAVIIGAVVALLVGHHENTKDVDHTKAAARQMGLRVKSFVRGFAEGVKESK